MLVFEKDGKKARRELAKWPHPVIALGNFDGVHLGHQQILKGAVTAAKSSSGTSICLTFYPHPAKILYPEKAPKLLQTPEQKRASIAQVGIDVLWIQPFDLKFSQIPYDIFFEEYLWKGFQPKGIRVGSRFAFGHNRQGTSEKLRNLCREKEIDFNAIEEFCSQGEAVSSSRIRKLLTKGEIAAAKTLLGRPYSVIGKVVPGEERGRQLGFATANLAVENEQLLPRGVYVCLIELLSAKPGTPPMQAVANLGVRPTFSSNQLESQDILEVHLLNFTGDLYDQNLTVFFLEYLRPEKKFSDREALRAQILADVEKSRQVFSALRLTY